MPIFCVFTCHGCVVACQIWCPNLYQFCIPNELSVVEGNLLIELVKSQMIQFVTVVLFFFETFNFFLIVCRRSIWMWLFEPDVGIVAL